MLLQKTPGDNKKASMKEASGVCLSFLFYAAGLLISGGKAKKEAETSNGHILYFLTERKFQENPLIENRNGPDVNRLARKSPFHRTTIQPFFLNLTQRSYPGLIAQHDAILPRRPQR
ncbi:hypothetical protein GIX45_14580 [Erwinia sp. CPCC 100877]|nr:hypothetical protein [Erwinia sp. CPCC 100877]